MNNNLQSEAFRGKKMWSPASSNFLDRLVSVTLVFQYILELSRCLDGMFLRPKHLFTFGVWKPRVTFKKQLIFNGAAGLVAIRESP